MKIRKIISQLTGKYKHLKKDGKFPHEWYGNTYGGFYVHPHLLNKESIVYSFGIGEDISFDLAIAEKHQCPVHCFDPTPKSIRWIKQQSLPTSIQFQEYGIASHSGMVDFYLPQNPDHVSGSLIQQKNIDTKQKVTVQMKSLKDIMTELNHTFIDVLKMDIEGSEYEVLEDIIQQDIAIHQILVEFHDRFFPNPQKSIHTVRMLRNAGYELFAVSDSMEEVSFIRL